MALIVVLSFLICSLFYLLNIFSIKPLIFELLTKPSFTTSYGYEFANPLFGNMQYMGILLGLESLSVLSYSIISFLISSYYKKDLSFKELLIRVARSWIRPLVTLFVQLSLWNICAVALLVSLSMFSNLPDTLFVFADSSKIPPLFVSVVWVVSLVNLVYEEISYEIDQARGKGAHLSVMARRLVGFLYYLLSFLLTAILFYIYFPHPDKGFGFTD